MFKIVIFVMMAVAYVSAKPQVALAYSAPLVASSAVVESTYHGVSAPYIAAPYVSAYSSPLIAPAAYSAYPYAAAYSAPLLFK